MEIWAFQGLRLLWMNWSSSLLPWAIIWNTVLPIIWTKPVLVVYWNCLQKWRTAWAFTTTANSFSTSSVNKLYLYLKHREATVLQPSRAGKFRSLLEVPLLGSVLELLSTGVGLHISAADVCRFRTTYLLCLLPSFQYTLLSCCRGLLPLVQCWEALVDHFCASLVFFPSIQFLVFIHPVHVKHMWWTDKNE